MKREIIDASNLELEDSVVNIKRVTALSHRYIQADVLFLSQWQILRNTLHHRNFGLVQVRWEVQSILQNLLSPNVPNASVPTPHYMDETDRTNEFFHDKKKNHLGHSSTHTAVLHETLGIVLF